MIIRIHEYSLLFIFIKIAYLKLECGELDKCQYCVGEESFFFFLLNFGHPLVPNSMVQKVGKTHSVSFG